MTTPYVPGENINAGKMYDRIEARLKALEVNGAQARQLAGSGTQSIANNNPTIITAWSTTAPLPYGVGSIGYANGLYTVTVAGLYQWEVTFTAPGVTAAYLRSVQAFVNGANVGQGQKQENVPANSNSQAVTASGSVPLNAGDTLAVRYSQASGASQTITPVEFTLTRVA